MKANRVAHAVATMSRVLGVSASGFYAWCRRAPSRRAQDDKTVLDELRHWHRKSRGTYGAPRLQRDLRDAGRWVSRKRIARLMRQAGLRGVSRRKWPVTTIRAVPSRPAPDLVQRAFTATAPNQLWVGDITYIPTRTTMLYLAVVLDVWSRRVVGWAMATHLRTSLVLAALDLAVRQRQPRGVIHHSDQGCQYTSLEFGRRCREAGVRPSMGSVGDCYDNAMCESFFATLECELLDRVTLASPVEGQSVVFDFIEGWYNPTRRHTALDYRSPVEFERQAQTPTSPTEVAA
jgi:transposase InsO family protein